MSYLYLDIETIPTQSDKVKVRIAETVKPPAAMKKADTIAAWEKETKPYAITEAVAKTSFDGGLGHVCCIGWAYEDQEPKTLSWDDKTSEKDALSQFAVAINKIGVPVIVGHYVADFDIRFLWQRAMVLGVRMPPWFPRSPKPWGGDVFDTMTAWAGVKGSISLDNLCFALGLEGKGDIDGSMVAQMWADGKNEEIAAYCMSDIVKVRNVHRKMMVAFGEKR